MRTSRITVADAASTLSELVERVNREQITLELERDDQVVARLSPPEASPRMPVANLTELFARLPRLGDDAQRFAEDVTRIRRELPKVADPWV